MKLTFDFSDLSRITFYGDEVSGFRSEDSEVKAIIIGEQLAQHKDGKLLIPSGSKLFFNFKPSILIESDFRITMTLSVPEKEFILCQGQDISIYLSKQGFRIESISNKQSLEIDFSGELNSKMNTVSLIREGGLVWAEIKDVEGVSVPDPFSDIFEITSFLGDEIVSEDILLTSMELTDELDTITMVEPEIDEITEIPTEEPEIDEITEIPTEEPEEEITEIPTEEPEIDEITEIPTEEPEEEIEDQPEEVDEPEEEIEDQPEEVDEPTENNNMKDLTKIETLIVSGYAGLLEAAKGTKVSKYYKTVEELQEAAAENKTFLVKIIYYVLLEQPEWKGVSHEAVKVRAYELFELFGKGIDTTEGRKYGFMDGVIYKSFKYGNISDEDLTDELIVELLVDEYEGVRDLIVKK